MKRAAVGGEHAVRRERPRPAERSGARKVRAKHSGMDGVRRDYVTSQRTVRAELGARTMARGMEVGAADVGRRRRDMRIAEMSDAAVADIAVREGMRRPARKAVRRPGEARGATVEVRHASATTHVRHAATAHVRHTSAAAHVWHAPAAHVHSAAATTHVHSAAATADMTAATELSRHAGSCGQAQASADGDCARCQLFHDGTPSPGLIRTPTPDRPSRSGGHEALMLHCTAVFALLHQDRGASRALPPQAAAVQKHMAITYQARQGSPA
ncbi:MAG TPA: hypothetical protein VL976_12940 [Xanthobacteraceae bacterium]|nr:hypothetical protein [Xanthobacteraceae bacterium]